MTDDKGDKPSDRKNLLAGFIPKVDIQGPKFDIGGLLPKSVTEALSSRMVSEDQLPNASPLAARALESIRGPEESLRRDEALDRLRGAMPKPIAEQFAAQDSQITGLEASMAEKWERDRQRDAHIAATAEHLAGVNDPLDAGAVETARTNTLTRRAIIVGVATLLFTIAGVVIALLK